ncbi:hypothetical protein RFI_39027 [Reticulomyxa filosa]|uniref:Uncharacterized protein n=1 Tax=Reticulomyxa filosa TaxID=46433 RepID=X6LAU8_RETFI|nr:hypothetical protein RFI_39027 [Reticulomyxa filosa]|eukprot:ETN98470.1 hypothetical protein RFI_39027 [Reticulomyxa filosa]
MSWQQTSQEGEEDITKTRKGLEEYFKTNNVRNAEKLADVFASMGVYYKDLMKCREKDIEFCLAFLLLIILCESLLNIKKKKRDICKEANVSVLSRVDLLDVLRNTPNSHMCKESQSKIQQPQLILLNASELEKMNELYEQSKQVGQRIKELQQYICLLEENTQKSKEQVVQVGKELEQGIDKFVQETIAQLQKKQQQKSEQLQTILSTMAQQELQSKQTIDHLSSLMNDPSLDITQRRSTIANFLHNCAIPSSSSISQYLFLTTNAVAISATTLSSSLHVVCTLSSAIAIIDDVKIELKKAYVYTFDNLTVWLEWTETRSTEWKEEEEKGVYEIEMGKMEDREWEKIAEIDTNVAMCNNKKYSKFKIQQQLISDNFKCKFRMRLRDHSQFSNVANLVMNTTMSDPSLSITTSTFKGYYSSYHPNNLFKSDESYYASNRTADDWIVFECSNEMNIHLLTYVHIRCRGDDMGVKEMKIEYSESADKMSG